MASIDPRNYKYDLPDELIARAPKEPRDSSRLMVVDTAAGRVVLDVFSNLHKYLPPSSLLVFNKTKVLPARIDVFKETGGRVTLLLLVNEYREKDRDIKCLSNKKLSLGQRLKLDDKHYFLVSRQQENIFLLEPQFDRAHIPGLLMQYGTTPVPHYIGDTGVQENDLRQRYQSVFAEEPASVAAPTASLHFTGHVLENIRAAGAQTAFLTLHVGLGTFAPLKQENIDAKKLHEEYYAIDATAAAAIAEKVRQQKPVIAVGTTTLRALESSGSRLLSGKEVPPAKTDIFIYPPYDFQVATGLITNFHLPESSLMMLVDAFLQHKKSQTGLLPLYERAIKEKMRFYSFGDAMLII